MTKLRILRDVFQDTQAATKWYDDQEPGLGDQFLNRFRATYGPIVSNPLAYRPVYKNFRRVLLRPFPYFVYFRLEGDTAVITLVYHSSRDPETLRRVLLSREKRTDEA